MVKSRKIVAVVLAAFCLILADEVHAASPAEGPKHYPQRVVSLGPTNTENVYLLGAGDRLVGNTMYCVRPEDAKKKPKVGTMMEISVEKVVSLRPDLILATGLTPDPVINNLRKLGLEVVEFDQPSSLAKSCEQFVELGRLLGLQVRAEQIVNRVRTEIKLIQQEVSQFPPAKVLLQIGSQPLFASIDGTFTHDYIKLANGVNVVADQTSGRTDYEKVIVRNPDVIIIAIMGSEAGIAGQEKRKWQQYPVISAVRQNRVHIIDPDITCSPSPVTFAETLRLFARYIHPHANVEVLN